MIRMLHIGDLRMICYFYVRLILVLGMVFVPISPAMSANNSNVIVSDDQQFFDSDQELENYLRHKHPRRLIISGGKITDNGLRALQYAPDIEELNLSGLKIGDVGVQHVSYLKNLKILYLSGLPVTDDGVKAISKLQALKKLYLPFTRITDRGLRMLKEMIQLESLSLYGCNITDEGIRDLTELKHLSSLTLANTKITNGGVRHLRRLTELKMLSLAGCKVDDICVDTMYTLNNLYDIDFGGTEIGDHGIEFAAKQLQLRSLSLGTNSTDAGLIWLVKIKHLETLQIANTKITDQGLRSVKHELREIRIHSLELRGLSLSDAVLKYFDPEYIMDLKCCNIRRVSGEISAISDMPRLTWLSLIDVPYEDGDLAILKNATQLRWLQLGSRGITDSLVPTLQSLPNVEEILLQGTRISENNQRRLENMIMARALKISDTREKERKAAIWE
jgi:internalin A